MAPLYSFPEVDLWIGSKSGGGGIFGKSELNSVSVGEGISAMVGKDL
jgi:hypothetical protein